MRLEGETRKDMMMRSLFVEANVPFKNTSASASTSVDYISCELFKSVSQPVSQSVGCSLKIDLGKSRVGLHFASDHPCSRVREREQGGLRIAFRVAASGIV